MSTPFLPGLELSRLLYEAALPIVEAAAPGVPYAAGRLGSGSDVLGFDTPRSTDHGWGPQLTLFFGDDDLSRHRAAIDARLRAGLPPTVAGWPTNFLDSDDGGWVEAVPELAGGPINHHIEITSVAAFAQRYLGIEALAELDAVAWLTMPEQALRTVADGRVFADADGELTGLRARLATYPDDIWRYRVAAQWRRIAQEEAFVGRCGELGDDLGSRVVATRLARDAMRLALLLERQYAPYSKWLGTAFARLACAPHVGPGLAVALAADTWQAREAGLCAAYEALAALHNASGVGAPQDPRVRPFYSRPFRVIGGDRLADSALAAIRDAVVLALPPYIGGIDQWADSTDAQTDLAARRRVASVYRAVEGTE